MPTTTRSRTQSSRTVLERDWELEALGLGIAPGSPGGDRSELVERAGVLGTDVEIGGVSPVLEP